MKEKKLEFCKTARKKGRERKQYFVKTFVNSNLK